MNCYAIDIIEPEQVPAIYKSVVDQVSNLVNNDGYSAEYFLYDITGDGTPELWVSKGKSYGDTKIEAYTASDEGTKQILDAHGPYTEYFVYNGGLTGVMNRQDAGVVISFSYDGDMVKTDEVPFTVSNEDGKPSSTDSIANKKLEYWSTIGKQSDK